MFLYASSYASYSTLKKLMEVLCKSFTNVIVLSNIYSNVNIPYKKLMKIGFFDQSYGFQQFLVKYGRGGGLKKKGNPPPQKKILFFCGVVFPELFVNFLDPGAKHILRKVWE